MSLSRIFAEDCVIVITFEPLSHHSEVCHVVVTCMLNQVPFNTCDIYCYMFCIVFLERSFRATCCWMVMTADRTWILSEYSAMRSTRASMVMKADTDHGLGSVCQRQGVKLKLQVILSELLSINTRPNGELCH